ncbi:MAG: threonine synthase [Dialister sp.]|nr:threonine synthase [Dialister sp.]
MRYRSTRSSERASAEDALLYGLAKDGGLYVPESLPKPFISWDAVKDLTYAETAAFVLTPFLEEFGYDGLLAMAKKAYEGTFDGEDVVPLAPLSETLSLAELFHGRTCAFKDLALSLFPYLLTAARDRVARDKEILILTATSGDTGKAALEGFRDVPGVRIMVFYPSHGVSLLQKDQMQKQQGSNVAVFGIEGNFDDAQSALKRVFSGQLRQEAEEKGILLSSANSINIGRLFPQVAYYVWIWKTLVKQGKISQNEAFHIVVPTGNFGNILAAWIAKQIGTPIGQLVCASNQNRVLSDFFETGVYDINRDFYLTESPSMDILISSNFERFLYFMTGSPDVVRRDMEELSDSGRYEVSAEALALMKKSIIGGWASEEDMREAMRDVYERAGYLMDPHTAVAKAVYDKLRATGVMKEGHTVIAATAHPDKFPVAVSEALSVPLRDMPYDMLRAIEAHTGVAIPRQMAALETLPVRFDTTIQTGDIETTIERYAGTLSPEVTKL